MGVILTYWGINLIIYGFIFATFIPPDWDKSNTTLTVRVYNGCDYMAQHCVHAVYLDVYSAWLVARLVFLSIAERCLQHGYNTMSPHHATLRNMI